MARVVHRLVTRDGVVYVSFAPPLDADHERELAVIACLPNTAAELRARLVEAARRWGCEVQFHGAPAEQAAY